MRPTGIAVASPDWRGLKVALACSNQDGGHDIAVASPDWRGLKVPCKYHSIQIAHIAVASPDWRGLKVQTMQASISNDGNCSG